MEDANIAILQDFNNIADVTFLIAITIQDVFVTSGCSDALRIAIDCLGSEKKNILLPKPGFSLYQTVAGNRGIPIKFYDLDVGICICQFGLGIVR